MMPLALVTGSAGWLGSRLVHALVSQKIPIRCMVLPGENLSTLNSVRNDAEIFTGDITDPEACAAFCKNAAGAVLFHTAGLIHPRKIPDLYRINVGGTENLLTASSRASVKRAVIVSSNSPCGCNPHPDHLFDESSPYRPYMNYGRSKMLMELTVRRFQEQGSLETVVLRPPWFYGPHQPARQTLFFKMIRQGKAPIVGGGENLRSMTDVDHLCQALLLAATDPNASGKTFWIADRHPYSMNHIVDTLERLIEKEFGKPCSHQRLRLPGFVSSFAYLADKALQSAGLYNQKIHVLSEMNKTIASSVLKAERELGFNPADDLEAGMRRSLQWCRDNGIDF